MARARCRAVATRSVVIVVDMAVAMILREQASLTPHRYTQPSRVRRYVMSVTQTAFTRCRSQWRRHRSGIECVRVPGRVVTGRNRRGLTPQMPCRRIEAATVLRSTAIPARTRTACTRGAP